MSKEKIITHCDLCGNTLDHSLPEKKGYDVICDDCYKVEWLAKQRAKDNPYCEGWTPFADQS